MDSTQALGWWDRFRGAAVLRRERAEYFAQALANIDAIDEEVEARWKQRTPVEDLPLAWPEIDPLRHLAPTLIDAAGVIEQARRVWDDFRRGDHPRDGAAGAEAFAATRCRLQSVREHLRVVGEPLVRGWFGWGFTWEQVEAMAEARRRG
jgi:hypothetical protein